MPSNVIRIKSCAKNINLRYIKGVQFKYQAVFNYFLLVQYSNLQICTHIDQIKITLSLHVAHLTLNSMYVLHNIYLLICEHYDVSLCTNHPF